MDPFGTPKFVNISQPEGGSDPLPLPRFVPWWEDEFA